MKFKRNTKILISTLLLLTTLISYSKLDLSAETKGRCPMDNEMISIEKMEDQHCNL